MGTEFFCPTISFSICGKTMKNNDSKFNQKPLIAVEPFMEKVMDITK